ncbi:MAG: hypothetical protein ACYTA5_17985 [Planctomycetota bacterium]
MLVLASLVTVFFVQDMVSWFIFINSAMVIFLLPLSWFRFFWWRFNVCGELAAIVLGLPISILVWFVLDFQSPARPMWQGLGLLFITSFVVLITITLLTPSESPETLKRFYARCCPPGLWKPVRDKIQAPDQKEQSMGHLLFDSTLGVLACLGLVQATNALFVSDWPRMLLGLTCAVLLGIWLIRRVLDSGNQIPENR